MIISEAAAQLLNVENGITSGSTISAVYNHTMGPKENPKFPIKTNNPVIIIALPN